MTIDIGADAIDREYASNNAVYNQCYIEGHPATESRTVTKIRVFIKGSVPYSLQIGSMYKTNGDVFSSRDWGIVLTPVDGLNEYTRWQHEGSGSWVDIEMEVQAGDYIGVRMFHAPSGNGIALDTGVGLGRWRTLSENVSFPFTDKEFNFLADQEMSLNGEMAPPITPPTVTTDPATGIEATAATGKGNITNNGGEDCDKRGFVYNTSPHGDPGNIAPADSEYSNYVEETNSFGTGAFTRALTSLDPKTTYYFRAYAHNSAGYSYGNEVSFTTLAAIPSVTTNAATGLAAIAATLNGTLDDDGGEACECGFEWGLDTGYGTTTPPQSKTTGETFSQVIGGLFPSTTYHFRAFATNSAGTSYGADRSFATALVTSKAYALAREEL